MKLFFIFVGVFHLVSCKESESSKIITVNKEHLMQDFLDIFGSWSTIFSDGEMDFRYFAAHDYDNNKKLDGLELLAALSHENEHENEHGNENKHLQLANYEKQVDDIFLENDTNNDGYLNYKEFLSVQRAYPGSV